MKQKAAQPRELVLHDWLNIYALPVLTLASILGLVGLIDSYQVTLLFIAYITFDLAWLYLYPTSVPSLSNVILGHHIVTLALLSFPLRRREFGHFTCWDGLTEFNTWFMVARRQLSSQRNLLSKVYWITFIPLRLVLYPGLLVKFWTVLEGYPMSERMLVCTCQFLLCCFNYGVFSLSMSRRVADKNVNSRKPASAAEHAHGSVPSKADVMQTKARHHDILIRAHGGMTRVALQ